MSIKPETVDDWLDFWEELYESGAVSEPEDFFAKYVEKNSLTESELYRLRNDIKTLLAANRRINSYLPEEEVTGRVSLFLQEKGSSNETEREPLLEKLAPHIEIIPGYTLQRQLGKGGFGEVWLATGPGGFFTAMKFIPRTGQGNSIERASLDVIRDIHHPNLIPIYGAWETDDFFVIAMAPADKTLMDLYQVAITKGRIGLEADELIAPFRDIAKTLDFLNGTDQLDNTNNPAVSHGDVKPQNILLSGGSVWLGDLGLACLIVPNGPTKHLGNLTIAFAAPECLDGFITRFSDQYSFALTWYFLRTGSVSTVDSENVLFPQNHSLVHSILPFEERKVLSRALAKIPSDRFSSCCQFVDSLEHAQRLLKCRRYFSQFFKTTFRLFSIVSICSLLWFLLFSVPGYYANRYNRIGTRELSLGNWEEACNAYTMALEKNGDSIESLNGRARSFIELGLLNKAIRDLDHIQRIGLANAESKYLRGIVAVIRESPELAIQAFSEAVLLDTTNSKYYCARAEQEIVIGKKKEAFDDLNKSIQLDMGNSEAYFQRSKIQENHDSALSDLTTAIRLAPNNAKYLLHRSFLFMEHGDEILALADATAVTHIAPSVKEVYLLKAEIYDRLGQKDKSEQEMKQATRESP